MDQKTDKSMNDESNEMKKTTAEKATDFEKITPPLNAKPKRKYKRRKKTDASVRPKTEKVFELVFNNIIVKRAGENWRMSSGELIALGTVTDDLIEKYSNEWLNKYAEEMAFIMVAGGIIVPRFLGMTGAENFNIPEQK